MFSAIPATRILHAGAAQVAAETASGKVRGSSTNGVDIFRGIPYGGPTEGPGRFMPPSKPEKWAGVRDATVNGPQCVQRGGNAFTSEQIGPYFSGGRPDRAELVKEPMSENCLVLNVLTPALKGRRPVMVYMHGGGYGTQSGLLSLFSDRHVREQDVVLVGINHRLGVFGYSYLGGLSEKFAVGNVGQLDLIAALEWVRDNIAHFGGDPKNVTIFGESGGGGKVGTLMGMPGGRGLFHKAIVQSGSMLRVGDPDAATKTAKALMDKLNVTKPEDLQKIPAADLFKAGGGGGPVLDGHSIPKQPWDPTAPAESAGVPFLVGNCKDETTLGAMSNPSLFSLDEAGLKAALANSGIPADKVDPLLALYHRDHPKDSPSDLYFRISTDRGARRNAATQAELKLAGGTASVFVYYFQWNTPLEGGKLRAFHTSDLPLEMRLTLYPESEHLSRQLSGAWAAFARTGNPSQKGLPWPKYTLDQRATMMCDVTECKAVNYPDQDEREMLREFPSGGRGGRAGRG
ncbi:MAG TPA: carboxylesterase family protein [Bryobacteraceae bacterium]|nr:carboxylesterase family protein [Bryobacteraceae bacterium]